MLKYTCLDSNENSVKGGFLFELGAMLDANLTTNFYSQTCDSRLPFAFRR
jgi:hypothetical protein